MTHRGSTLAECIKVLLSMLAKERLEFQVMNERARVNKQVLKKVIDLTDTIKAKNNIQKEILDKENEIRNLQVDLGTRQAEKNHFLISLGMLILEIEREGNQVQMDRIFIPEDQEENIVIRRRRMADLTRILTIIYDLDPVTLNMPEDIRQTILEETLDW